MGIEFLRPLAWLALLVCIACIWLVNRFAGRRKKGLKHTVTLVIRHVLAFLLVAALAGPVLLLPGSQSATWVLVDASASARGRSSAMEQALQLGLAAAPEDLQIGVIAFGQDAMVDAPLAAGRESVQLGTRPDAGSTDIGRALALALALLPDDTAGRIALLSDGLDNAQGLASQLSALQARGIAVDVMHFDSGIEQDAQVTSIQPPAQVYQGERFDVVVRVDSLQDTQGTLVLYANRQPVDTRAVTLRRGENTFIFQDVASQSGVVTYEAQLVAEGDQNTRNDRLGAYMDVRGQPHILVVGEGDELAPMLEAAGMTCDTMTASQLPVSTEALRQYHAVALVNVNDDDLSDGAVAALDDYVRTLGRGLAVFGGDDSYAIGGWRGSALEEMLPVTMDVDNRLEMSSLSLVLVIDKSGSMTEGSFGMTRLDMAKEAAMRSAEVLTARDNVGVIAFDDTAKWVVPMQQVEDVAAIQDMIGTIRPGGGTMFYSALAQSLKALIESESELKHVIFLTDGESGDGGYESVVQQMAQNDITLTTVAVGSGANARLLSRLAEIGGGRFYSASEFDDIPKVFTKETYLATQAYVQNRTFYPVIFSSGALTNYAGFPPLSGYLATTARPLATVSLATDRYEPLLAWWQYGAGRTLAWTSDTRGAWTEALLRWDEASAFFAGMLSHVLPAEEGEGELTISRTGDSVRFRYSIEADEQGLTTEGIVLAPDGQQQRITLSQTAPGVYEGELDAAQEGAYTVRIEQRKEGALLRTLESGVTVGYSAEYDLREREGGERLVHIAEATGGRLLEDASALFAERGTQTRGRREITTWLLIAALILFVLDVAQRRLAWERLLPARGAPAKVKNKDSEEKPSARERENTRKRKEKSRDAAKKDGEQRTDTGEKLLERRRKKLM